METLANAGISPIAYLIIAFNFLASLINGNPFGLVCLLRLSQAFNFLASLINGNFLYLESSWMRPFNFLASLINGNPAHRPQPGYCGASF